MAVSLPQMRHVIAVVEAGSFRAAGERLGVQQSAVSRSIQEFEESIGAKLFDRRSTGAKLTQVGEHITPEIVAILDAVDGLSLKARSYLPTKTDRLVLGLDLALSIHHIQPILTALREETPDLPVALTERNACQIVEAVLEGSVQLGLIRARELPTGIAVRRFLVGDIFAAIPSDWRDDGDTIDHLRLANYSINVATADIATEGVAQLRQVLGESINLTSHDCTPGSLVGLVASGMGIGLLTNPPAEPPTAAVKILRVEPTIPVIGVTALWSADAPGPDFSALLDGLGRASASGLHQTILDDREASGSDELRSKV